MSGPRAQDRLRLAIDVADAAFADRLASVLADCEGLELVGKDDEPDVLIVPAVAATNQPEADIALTARELEVLALLAEGASNKLIARRLGMRLVEQLRTAPQGGRGVRPVKSPLTALGVLALGLAVAQVAPLP